MLFAFNFGEWLANNQFITGGALLAVCGWMIVYLRAVPGQVFKFFKRRVTVTLDIEDRDEAFKWVSLWLSKHQTKKRDVSVVTRHKNKLHGDNDEEDFTPGKARDNRPNIFLTPAPGTHFLWFKGRPMIVYRKRNEGGGKGGGGGLLGDIGNLMRVEGYTITFFSRNQELPRLLLEEARDVALPRDDKIDVRVAQTRWYGHWELADRIRPRSIESVILAGDEHLKVLDDIREFLSSYQWYASLGIPYRRGYLLYGDPGNGKTSLVAAVASALKMNIYVLSLQAPGMNDSMLVELLTSVSSNSIILMEDVDCAFEKRKKKEETSDKLTFSGLLNALDGVGGKDGRIIFMTTNHKEKLDAALIRPGRIDYQIEIRNAVQTQVRKLFERFYQGFKYDADLLERFVATIPDHKYSMAKLQGHLMNYKDNPWGPLAYREELDIVENIPAPEEEEDEKEKHEEYHLVGGEE
jgi:chaperone BCS1